ncbi:MAG TPA: SDR family oxidoreductase [Burkholderiales bacterium]|nr:SDR family oxidoreductase [Burkholderiales bacterium]
MSDFHPALAGRKRTWLVTGSAGFIGSHLLEALLRLGQRVVSVDDLSTGKRENLGEVEQAVGSAAWKRHRFMEGSIADPQLCRAACRNVDIVLHQAALGSVPRSIADPLATHMANVTGFVNMLVAARDARARFVYASSSATYGDHPALPKSEGVIGGALSPYAVSKQANELYAGVFARCYGVETVGMRYFNVFGARQDPESAYAAVIPRWVRAMLVGAPVEINGDGETSRDFCYVANAVQANLRAALIDEPRAFNRVYNVAVGESTSLNRLFEILRGLLGEQRSELRAAKPVHLPFRAGDVRHSLADISLARELLGYAPTHTLTSGLREALSWYMNRFASTAAIAG